jgi:phosphoribosyl-ATP pyrophosphohydrolase
MTNETLGAVLDRLSATIASRKGADPESSYTARLLASGAHKCARKFGEEAVEAIIAATENDKAALASEAADVLYHLLTLLAAAGVSTDEAAAVLASREGASGLEEKAARRKN